MSFSLYAQQAEEPRLKPTFCLDLLEASIEMAVGCVGVVAGGFGVYEIAALSVHARAFVEEDPAFLGLVSAVGLLVLLELMRAVCEFALLLVGAEAEFYEFFAKLRLFLILPYGRFQLRDLLHINEKFKLELRESPEKGVFIKDVKKVPITTVAEMMKYLKIGNQNRTTGETLMNTESSRSHSIFTIYVESLEKGPENIDKLVGSKFNLVDLAGSERQSKTGSIGDRFLEATKINLSLTALGKVISVLVEGKGSFIPYRDSKLTRLLQDSLGGNAKTVMIATVSPSSYNYEETISTLKYASRAKYITNVPIINLDPKDALLKEYESEIRRLRSALGEIQKEDQPNLDLLIEENRRITKEAEEEKKELISKIQKLEEQFISTPYELPQKYKEERNIREQKLSFMEKNYKSLEEEVSEMKELLNDLRKKYKAASKEIFQMESEHEKER
ncbi:uncharacterized protein LOC116244724 [Nymphaea colorata]|nr:uncharacterized protein LOC116244724 [Nymphaea colorata]